MHALFVSYSGALYKYISFSSHLHFTDVETETQRGEVTCPESQL